MSNTLLRLGDVINLQAYGRPTAERCPVKLIGVADGLSLIVVAGASNDSRSFVLGEQYVARCLSGTSVYGFTTEVIKIAIDPYAYLHLSYPKEVQTVGVRQSERVKVCIPVAVRSASGESHAGTIIDLSPTGAQVTSSSAAGQVGAKMTLAFDAVFAGVTSKFESAAAVKSTRELTEKSGTGEKQHSFGVQFEGHSEHQRIFLSGFVYEQLLARRSAA
ncbi:MAG: flagellar brake protein [Betaproteobacteria bacterium]|nr:flagellar brake protein [Betaproteobacteria bacterium]